jgi:hypothetical protein
LGGGLRLPGWVPCGLEPIFLHPAVERAAAEAEGFGGLAHVSLGALQCLADENRFHGFEAELFEILALRTKHVEAEVGALNLAAAAHQDGALESVLQFAHVAGPGVLQQQLQGGNLETFYGTAVTRGIARKKMPGEGGNILAAFAQCGHVNLDGIQAEEQVFAKLAGSAGRAEIGIGGGD